MIIKVLIFVVLLLYGIAVADVYKCNTTPVTYQDVPCDTAPLSYQPPPLSIAQPRDPFLQLEYMRYLRDRERAVIRPHRQQFSWGDRQRIKENLKRIRRNNIPRDYNDALARDNAAIYGTPYYPGVIIDRR